VVGVVFGKNGGTFYKKKGPSPVYFRIEKKQYIPRRRP